MPRRNAKKIKHRILQDVFSSAVHDNKHRELTERITYLSRRDMVIYTLIFLLGVTAAVLIVTNVLMVFVNLP
jgi:hypothetical protein